MSRIPTKSCNLDDSSDASHRHSRNIHKTTHQPTSQYIPTTAYIIFLHQTLQHVQIMFHQTKFVINFFLFLPCQGNPSQLFQINQNPSIFRKKIPNFPIINKINFQIQTMSRKPATSQRQQRCFASPQSRQHRPPFKNPKNPKNQKKPKKQNYSNISTTAAMIRIATVETSLSNTSLERQRRCFASPQSSHRHP